MSEAPQQPGQPAALGREHLRVLRAVFSQARRYCVAQFDGVHLDLIALGLVEVIEQTSALSDGYGRLKMTEAGIARLHASRQAKVQSFRPHASLAERLAAHLQGQGMLTWLNVQIAKPGRTGIARPDLYALSGKNLIAAASQSMAVEVKVSRADWRAELKNPSKLEAYAGMAQRVYVCSPDGMILPEEVPKGVGLIYELGQGRGFVIKVKARRQKGFVPSPDVLLTLLIRMHAAHQRGLAQDGLDQWPEFEGTPAAAGDELMCA